MDLRRWICLFQFQLMPKKKKKKSLLIKIGSGKAKIQNAYDPKDQFNGKYIFLEVFVFKVTLPISTHGLQS